MQTLNRDTVTPSVKGAVLLAPCHPFWCLKSATHGGQGLNWLGKMVCLENNPFVVHWGTLQADHFAHLLPGRVQKCLSWHTGSRGGGGGRIVAGHTQGQFNTLGLQSK